jgi:hypothetical protein
VPDNIETRQKQTEFQWTHDELQKLSKCSHNRWWTDRILEGWSLGDTYDKPQKKAPNMKPYDALPDKGKEIDFAFIMAIPQSLKTINYHLERVSQIEQETISSVH